jgi:hypothetical protein
MEGHDLRITFRHSDCGFARLDSSAHLYFLQCREDDRQDHLTVLLNEILEVRIVPEKKNTLSASTKP